MLQLLGMGAHRQRLIQLDRRGAPGSQSAKSIEATAAGGAAAAASEAQAGATLPPARTLSAVERSIRKPLTLCALYSRASKPKCTSADVWIRAGQHKCSNVFVSNSPTDFEVESIFNTHLSASGKPVSNCSDRNRFEALSSVDTHVADDDDQCSTGQDRLPASLL